MPAAKIFETFKLLKSVNLSEWVNLHVIVFRLHEKQLRQSSSADSTVLGRKASGRCSYWSGSSHPYELTAAPYRPKLVWPWVQRRNLRAQISGAHLCLLGSALRATGEDPLLRETGLVVLTVHQMAQFFPSALAGRWRTDVLPPYSLLVNATSFPSSWAVFVDSSSQSPLAVTGRVFLTLHCIRRILWESSVNRCEGDSSLSFRRIYAFDGEKQRHEI